MSLPHTSMPELTSEALDKGYLEHDDANDKALPTQVHDMSAEDRAYELKKALEADPGIPVRSLRYLQLVGMMLVVCMCGGDAGFDGKPLSSAQTSLTRRHCNVLCQLHEAVPVILWFDYRRKEHRYCLRECIQSTGSLELAC